MNAAIEIHDSVLNAIAAAQDRVTMWLDPAYVHQSSGRPGYDPGSGWSQAVEIVLFGGQIETPLPEMPCTLDDGRVFPPRVPSSASRWKASTNRNKTRSSPGGSFVWPARPPAGWG